MITGQNPGGGGVGKGRVGGGEGGEWGGGGVVPKHWNYSDKKDQIAFLSH